MKIQKLFLPSLALGAAVVLTTPQESHGFVVLTGQVLGLDQTDYRVFNNFLDQAANDNTNQIANFPGYTGATLALWKGAYEWSSEARAGNGNGDPSQGILGSGNSNFDPMFTGEATSVSNGTNVIAALDLNGGGVFAFMQPSFGDSWMIRFYENWTWADGPGSVGGFVDLQNVGCHEYGHALGLNHSSDFGATMFASTSPGATNGRSINNDDIAGVQFIYGAKDADKPRIDSAFNIGGIVEIEGENFDPGGNEVWFTRANPTPANTSGLPIKVSSVPSSNGGTFISVLIPAGAGTGEVIVKNNGNQQADTSNAYPFDPLAVPPPPPIITSLSKAQVAPLAGAANETISIFGNDLLGVSDLTFNGEPVDADPTFAGSWTVVDNTQIDVTLPLASSAGLLDIEVTAPGGTAVAQVEVVAPATPQLAVEQDEVISPIGLDFATSSQFGDIVILLVSGFGTPTTIPNVIDLELGGNNPGAIFSIKTWNVGPKLWRKQGFGPFNILPSGVTLYFEGLVFEAANNYETPWSSTNMIPLEVII